MISCVVEAAAKAGGIVALASRLGIKHPSLHSWRRVPGHHCLEIERLTGIPREVLRPDIFLLTPGTIPISDSDGPESYAENSGNSSGNSELFTAARKEVL